MSIYASWLTLGDGEHEDGCAIYVEDPPGSNCFEFSGEPCDCGTPRAPIVYEGSHVLPSNTDRRAGYIDVAGIPDHIVREGREDGREGVPKDWLRLSVGSVPSTTMYGAALVLDRALVMELRDTLTAWLEREEAA
jgi:hypothetical protein